MLWLWVPHFSPKIEVVVNKKWNYLWTFDPSVHSKSETIHTPDQYSYFRRYVPKRCPLISRHSFPTTYFQHDVHSFPKRCPLISWHVHSFPKRCPLISRHVHSFPTTYPTRCPLISETMSTYWHVHSFPKRCPLISRHVHSFPTRCPLISETISTYFPTRPPNSWNPETENTSDDLVLIVWLLSHSNVWKTCFLGVYLYALFFVFAFSHWRIATPPFCWQQLRFLVRNR